jgi:ribose/xylose/arabinose/galactoside ABC-type transport system permease subunit
VIPRRISRFLRVRILFLLAGNGLLLALIFALLGEGGSFLDVLQRSASNVAPTVLAGLGMTGIVCAGAIDLSVGAVIALAGSVFGIFFHWGAPPAACYAAAFGSAALVSTGNGLLVRLLGIPPIILTLAGLSFYRGAALIAADAGIPDFSGNITVSSEAFHVPGKFLAGWILLGVLGVAFAWESASETPRRWLARGNSVEACRLQGLSPDGILLSAYGIGGLFLGFAALLLVTRSQSIEPARMGLGFELAVIGAVVLGGTNIFGGEGCYAGTVLGAFFLHLTGEALVYAGTSVYWREVITGGTIIAVIGIDCGLHRRRKLLEELR